jgi:hypothetical protein
MPDFKPNGFEFTTHLAIPEAQRLDSLCSEKAVALFIVLPLLRKTMSPSIKFDRELRFNAKEIEEVCAARILATEFKIIEAPVAQETPETFFRVGGFLA